MKILHSPLRPVPQLLRNLKDASAASDIELHGLFYAFCCSKTGSEERRERREEGGMHGRSGFGGSFLNEICSGPAHKHASREPTFKPSLHLGREIALIMNILINFVCLISTCIRDLVIHTGWFGSL